MQLCVDQLEGEWEQLPMIDSISILESIIDAHGITWQNTSVTVFHLSSISHWNNTDCYFVIWATQK